MAPTPAASAETEAAAQLRERYLSCWLGVVGAQAEVQLFNDPQPVCGRLMATDAHQRELVVADFDTGKYTQAPPHCHQNPFTRDVSDRLVMATALGRVPHALLRTSDVMAVRVELQGTATEAPAQPEPDVPTADLPEHASPLRT